MNDSKIPVIVLTGFLGSGKTTLLNQLLNDGQKTAVIINEFGSTPIDQDLLQKTGMPLTILSGGCLCCQIKGALAPTLKNLWMAWSSVADKPFERIIIEASGVASPGPIIDTLLRERWLSSRYRLQTVLSTLAISSALEQMARFPQALAQVVWADTLVLTHEDLATSTECEQLAQRLQVLAPGTPCFVATHGQIDPAKLQTERRFRHLTSNLAVAEHDYRSLSICLQRPMAWEILEALLKDLLARHGALIRIKGVVFLPEQIEPIAVHAAMGRLNPLQTIPSRESDDRFSRLVFIVVGAIEPLADDVRTIFNHLLGKDGLRLH